MKINIDDYIIKYLNGDIDAFDVIYEETKQTVYLSIYSIIKNKTQIEDLMQDTYLKAINNISNYKLYSNFKAWIARIARNNAINYYNKMKNIAITDPESDFILNSFDASSSLLLDSALKILEGDEKEILIYKIILDLTFKEISEIMNLSLSRVFYLYKQLLKKIKKKI